MPVLNDDGEESCVVIDNGSGMCRAGIAGNDVCNVQFSSLVGHPKNDTTREHLSLREFYVGDEAQAKREALLLKYPMEHGIVTDWDSMEKIWEHVFFNALHVPPEEQGIILTERIMSPRSQRETMTQIMFEKFDTPAFYLANQSAMALYTSGRSCGVVVDIGDGVTHVVPYFESHALINAMRRVDFAGRDLTHYLADLLHKRDLSFTSVAELEVIRDIKENLCVFPADKFETEMTEAASSLWFKKPYELPGGQIINIGVERYQCPEALFNPSLMGRKELGIHELIHDTIKNCDVDAVKDMYVNILINGGSTCFPGFPERLEKEMKKLLPSSRRVRVVASPERKYSVWIGGSILGSLCFFQNDWILKKDYDEHGPSVVQKYCRFV